MIMDVEVAWTLSGKDLYQDPDLHFHLRLVGGIGGARAGAGVSRILALRGYRNETSTETKGRL